MNEIESNRDDYRRQLARWAHAMAVGRNEDVDHLAATMTPAHVKLFTDGNLDKRFEKLRAQADMLDEVFDDLEERIEDYIHAIPLQAYDARSMDCDRLLAWIEHRGGLDGEQRDYLQCLRAQHTVEAFARANRAGYLRFQELRSLVDPLLGELTTNPALKVHLNPTRVWTRFETRALLDDLADLPADVLMFADRGDIRTAVLEDAGRDLVRVLEQIGPSTLKEWTTAAERDEGEVCDVTRDLADLGLVAFS